MAILSDQTLLSQRDEMVGPWIDWYPTLSLSIVHKEGLAFLLITTPGRYSGEHRR